MLSAAVMMGSSKLVAALLGAKADPNASKGNQARKSVFFTIKIHGLLGGEDRGMSRKVCRDGGGVERARERGGRGGGLGQAINLTRRVMSAEIPASTTCTLPSLSLQS